MPKTRVLVVEDSATVRQRLVDILGSDPDIELVGEAEDGKRAIELCQQYRPDAITMDMMLPLMSGLAATEYIMAHCPTPILVVSASTNRGELFKIYEALAAGAVDVLDKPTGTEVEGAWEQRFLSTVKLVARIRVITHPRARLAGLRKPAPEVVPASIGARRPTQKHDLVAIGASTGGPAAIVEILRGLPAEFQLPILLVLHINEPFGTAFADWLDGADQPARGLPEGWSPASPRPSAASWWPPAADTWSCATGACISRPILSGIPAGPRLTFCSSRSRGSTGRPPRLVC